MRHLFVVIMRHLFVVDSLDPLIQNEKELIHPASAGGGGLFCICVESTNLNLNLVMRDTERFLLYLPQLLVR